MQFVKLYFQIWNTEPEHSEQHFKQKIQSVQVLVAALEPSYFSVEEAENLVLELVGIF